MYSKQCNIEPFVLVYNAAHRVILSLEIPNYCLKKLSIDQRMMNQLLGITNKTVQHVTLQMLACEKMKVFFKTKLSQKKIGNPDLPI